MLWPAARAPSGRLTSPATASPAGAAAAKLAWLVLWGSFAGYLLLPANRAPGAISALLSRANGQPGWVTAIMNGLSRAADHRGRCSGQRSSWQLPSGCCSGSPKDSAPYSPGTELTQLGAAAYLAGRLLVATLFSREDGELSASGTVPGHAGRPCDSGRERNSRLGNEISESLKKTN
jgi:hypothetical protein